MYTIEDIVNIVDTKVNACAIATFGRERLILGLFDVLSAYELIEKNEKVIGSELNEFIQK